MGQMSKYYAGVDIGGTAIKCGVTDERSKLLWMRECPAESEPVQAVSALVKLIRMTAETYDLAGLGVACAGAIDSLQGVVLSSDNLRWYHLPLAAMIKEHLNLTVRIENDAQAALLGEWRFGVCGGMKNVVYVTLGTGVGGALLIDGKPYRGAHHCGAEIGHMLTHAGGRLCSCGLHGCFEAYASASALLHRAWESVPTWDKPLTVRTIIENAKEEGAVKNVFNDYLREISNGLLSLMSLFEPEAIVLGGGLSNAGSYLLDGIMSCLRREKTYLDYYQDILVLIAAHGNNAGVIGAASLCM
jgi:glucokinase